jgi:DNA repair protein RecN (Recombination protein N)
LITQLSIKNFALIEDIKVNFKEGFTIITGETGAGKSILLGALSLLLGKRADLSSIKNSSKKCIIEGEFQISSYRLKDLFVSEDIDYEDITIIRREILPNGKSRAFINDTPATLSTLSVLAEKLIDIHNQHQTLEISSQDFQFNVIDALADNKTLLDVYKIDLTVLKEKKKQLQQLIDSKNNAQRELDYNTFLLEELEEARLKPDEFTTLEEEYEKLNNVESIQENLAEIIELMNNEELGVIHILNEIKSKINKLKTLSTSFETLSNRLESIQIELKDIHLDLSSELDTAEANPERLQEINDRLQILNKLMSKHQSMTVDQLIAIRDSLAQTVEETTGLDLKIQTMQQDVAGLEFGLNENASKIHQSRISVLTDLTNELEKTLSGLGMPNAKFKIELSHTNNFYENGKDELSFLFTANKGGAFGELKKVASGGELSRIMLAIKSILANYSQLPTIIFDEIDTGVSGEVANKIADILKSMSQKMQVISITHLPQIAAKGDNHFKVYKEDLENQTFTRLKALSHENRIVELAEMLSGEKKSDSALAHARELLN